jgi:hypothetical protein
MTGVINNFTLPHPAGSKVFLRHKSPLSELGHLKVATAKSLLLFAYFLVAAFLAVLGAAFFTTFFAATFFTTFLAAAFFTTFFTVAFFAAGFAAFFTTFFAVAVIR